VGRFKTMYFRADVAAGAIEKQTTTRKATMTKRFIRFLQV
jgi:hypothetical protein